jgi:hypothetical protein
MSTCDEVYWDLRSIIEVVCGPLSMLRRVKGITAIDDVAVHVDDVDKVPEDIGVFRVRVVGFSNRAIYVGGLPHISLEDYVASIPLNREEYTRLLSNFNLRNLNIPLTLRLAEEAGTLKEVDRLFRAYGINPQPE